MYSITFPTFSFKEKSEASLRSKLPFKTRCSLRISRFFEKDDRSSMLTIAGFGAEGIGGGKDLENTSKLLCNDWVSGLTNYCLNKDYGIHGLWGFFLTRIINSNVSKIIRFALVCLSFAP